MMLITPLYSLFLKGGIFSRTGWLYAIDRMVAEALMFRGSVLNKLNASSACGRNEGLTK
jgi:hypothetical protein